MKKIGHITVLALSLLLASPVAAMAPSQDPVKKTSVSASLVKTKERAAAYAYELATTAMHEAVITATETFDSLAKVPGAMINRVNTMRTTMLNKFKNMPTQIGNTVTTAYGKAKGLPGQTIKSASQTASASYSDTKGSVLNIGDTATGSVTAAGSAVSGSVKTVTSAPSQTYSSATGSIESAWNSVTGIGSGTGSSVSGTTGGSIKTVFGMPGQVIDQTGSTVTGAISNIQNLPNQLKDQSKDMAAFSVREIARMPKSLANKIVGKKDTDPFESISEKLSRTRVGAANQISYATDLNRLKNSGQKVLSDIANMPSNAAAQAGKVVTSIKDVPGTISGQAGSAGTKVSNLDETIAGQVSGSIDRVTGTPANLQAQGQGILGGMTGSVDRAQSKLANEPQGLAKKLAAMPGKSAAEMMGIPGQVMNDVSSTISDAFDIKKMIGGSFSDAFKSVGAVGASSVTAAFERMKSNSVTRAENWVATETGRGQDLAAAEIENIIVTSAASAIESKTCKPVASLEDIKAPIRKAIFTASASPSDSAIKSIVKKREKLLKKSASKSLKISENIRKGLVNDNSNLPQELTAGKGTIDDIRNNTKITRKAARQLWSLMSIQVQMLDLTAKKDLMALTPQELKMPDVSAATGVVK